MLNLSRSWSEWGRAGEKNDVPAGYAFIEFDHERDLKNAYKQGDGKKIDGRRVMVDVERGRTVEGWLPRRLGGGRGPGRQGKPAKKKQRRLAETTEKLKEKEKEEKKEKKEKDKGEKDKGKEKEKAKEKDDDRKDRRDREKEKERSASVNVLAVAIATAESERKQAEAAGHERGCMMFLATAKQYARTLLLLFEEDRKAPHEMASQVYFDITKGDASKLEEPDEEATFCQVGNTRKPRAAPKALAHANGSFEPKEKPKASAGTKQPKEVKNGRKTKQTHEQEKAKVDKPRPDDLERATVSLSRAFELPPSKFEGCGLQSSKFFNLSLFMGTSESLHLCVLLQRTYILFNQEKNTWRMSEIRWCYWSREVCLMMSIETSG
eukprot:g27572.t1